MCFVYNPERLGIRWRSPRVRSENLNELNDDGPESGEQKHIYGAVMVDNVNILIQHFGSSLRNWVSLAFGARPFLVFSKMDSFVGFSILITF